MTPVVRDVAARDLVASALDTTLFVPAGAGSGKTTSLVNRILTILLEGAARIEQVAAITFTEAAAGELRDRLAERLEIEAQGEGERAERARVALSGLDGASISTLHGFARRILAEHPFAAGLPPIFDVTDEATSRAQLEERWPEMLVAMMDTALVAHGIQLLDVCGVSITTLRSVARIFNVEWDRLHLLAQAPRTIEEPTASTLLRALKEATLLKSVCTNQRDNLYQHLESLETIIDTLESVGEGLALIGYLSATKSFRFKNGKKEAWRGRKDDVLAACAVAEHERSEILASVADDALRVVCASVASLVSADVERRRHEGHLHFHDLLVFARDVLRDDVETRRAVHRQFRYLLIDEFQDTDPIQVEIAAWIATSTTRPLDPSDPKEFYDLDVEPGRLFFVGDPVQSIYRFRRADISVFERVKEVFATEVAAFTTNFRSVRPIVDWLNAVFSEVIGEARTHQPAYRPADAHREETASEVAAVTLLASPSSELAADDARAFEAKELAAWLADAHRRSLPVDDEGRAVRYSDMAVLVPTRTSLPALEAALQGASVPYRLEASSLAYASVEVSDLVNVLRALDDPNDALAVVAALRTPGGGCSDRELVAWRQSGATFDYTRVADPTFETPTGCEQALDAMRRLDELHRERPFHPVSWTVGQAIDRFCAMRVALADDRVREIWRRLRFVLDQARLFEEKRGGDLRAFISWIEIQRDDDARVYEQVLPETDLDAVRILTVHAAKGLEFPIVAVVGFGFTTSKTRYPMVLNGEESLEVCLAKSFATHGFTAAEEVDKAHDEMERLRLFYVAVTRARDHLIVSLVQPKRAAKNNVAAKVHEALRRVEGVEWAQGFPPLDGAVDRPAPPRPRIVERALGADLRSFLEHRAARLERVPASISATSVAKLRKQSDERDEESETSIQGRRLAAQRGRGATSFGRAVHAVLQEVDLPNGERLDALARRHALAEGIDGSHEQIAHYAGRALGTEVLRRASASRHWRELYVGTDLGPHLLEGIVDLLYRDESGYHVVDYKTDRVTTMSDADRLVERYRLQGAAYAVALEAVLGEAVRDVTFLFLAADPALGVTIGDLGAACKEVRVVLAGDDGGVCAIV